MLAKSFAARYLNEAGLVPLPSYKLMPFLDPHNHIARLNDSREPSVLGVLLGECLSRINMNHVHVTQWMILDVLFTMGHQRFNGRPQVWLKHGPPICPRHRTGCQCHRTFETTFSSPGAGNGDVVTALVEAAADVGAMCWQTTPLMAAADSGHIWALRWQKTNH